MTPKVEEFFNHFHSPKDGKFSIGGAPGRYKSGPGKGLFSIAKTSKRGPKHSLLGFKPHARQSFSTPYLEEFYNHVHDSATGRFSGRAASGRAGFREGSHTGPGKSVTYTAKKGAMETVPRMFSPKNITTRRFSTHVTHAPSVGGKATPHNFPRGDKRAGPSHSKTEVSPGQVYTSLKGSHTIRQTKSGKMVLHTKNSAPQVVSKAAAEHVKKLDQHKVTAAEAVRGKIARWNAKG